MANLNSLDLLPSMEQVQSSDNVSTWLQDCGLMEHIPTFRKAGYDDINLIKILNDEDLDAMGIEKPGTRKKILMYAAQLRASEQQNTPVTIEPSHPPTAITPRPKGNSRANPYRCTKCCEFKIRSLDGKAHQCQPELVGHSWDMCPTKNIRQHPEERQRRKHDQKASKGNRSRKRKGTPKPPPDELEEVQVENVTAWEYDNAFHTDAFSYTDEQGNPLFAFDTHPTKRAKVDISQQVADVSAAVMQNFISDEIAKHLETGDVGDLSIPLSLTQTEHLQF